MNFIKKIFGKKDEQIKDYDDFWSWFQNNEKTFYNIVKNNKNIEKGFFDKLSPKLEELKDGFFFLTGMFDENTVELIITADGNIRNIIFVEELIEKAPKLNGWKFTALKPEMKETEINMDGYNFCNENIFFYSNDYKEYPDEVDIRIVHNDLTQKNKDQIVKGTYIFLDNYLGELDFINNIDSLKIIGKSEAEKELISISKLKEFLTWRQKEFIEKYNGIRYNTEEDEHSILEAELENGNALIAVINTQLLNWERKASHPWIGIITFKYDGKNNNGMPHNADYETLNKIEESILNELYDKDGYLNVGRQTSNNERDIYFACEDFRKLSKVFYNIQQKNKAKFEIEYDIYKDKYWQSFERFKPN